MDQRQQQVQVGAGLQESRLNTEFIDFLRKYGTYGIYGLLVLVLGYVGYQKYGIYRQTKLDDAFAELDIAMKSRNVDSLLKVATEHKGQGAVWELASLSAAEYYLDAARTGYAVGSNPDAPTDADRLTESQVQDSLNKATSLLKDVLAATGGDKSKVLMAQRARWDLATAALNSNDPTLARKYLSDYENAAKAADLTDMVAIATSRAKSIDRVLAPVSLYSEAELPKPATTGGPVKIPGMGEFNVTGGTGRPITITPQELEELRKEGKLKPLDGQDPNQPIGTPVPTTDEKPAEPAPEAPPAPKPVDPSVP